MLSKIKILITRTDNFKRPILMGYDAVLLSTKLWILAQYQT